ncbi:MAG: 1,4-dihydroxy-6-naphthoate synthase [Rikenellaceae bacterium]
MTLRLAISTCPNDTFMFDALIHKRVDTMGLDFELTMCDIEELNQLADSSQVDICKISYGVYPQLKGRFRILSSGSALGRGNGPLLVSRHRLYKDELEGLKIAVPGLHTTANMLMTRLFGDNFERKPYLFSDIADVVLDDECEAGVLIHEGRFTYKNKGLSLVADLGAEWERVTSLPLPLGAIVVNNELSQEVSQKVDAVLRSSIEYAFASPMASYAFVKSNARELSDEVLKSHIDLFVNEFSVELGDDGRRAVQELLGDKDPDIFLAQS